MAISVNTVWEVRTAGSDTNGGGFVTGAAGTDYSQQDAANSGANDKSTTDAVAVGTTTITSLTANFQTTIVGNIVYFAGGTGTITGQWRQVTARASTTSITIDAAIAASTGMTMNIGGAQASPGQAAASMLSTGGNKIWIKAGTYTITSASTNIAAGCVTVAGNAVTAMTRFEGYQTTRGDRGTKPSLVLNAGVSTATIFAGTGNYVSTINIEFDGAAQTTSRGVIFASSTMFAYKCHAKNFTNSGFVTGTSGNFIYCSATACSTQPAFSLAGTSGGSCQGCEAYANTVTGFSNAAQQGLYLVDCISRGNTGASSDGFLFSDRTGAVNCTAYGNGQHGFSLGTQIKQLVNCVATGNGGYGFRTSSAGTHSILLVNCAGYSNSSGNYSVADFLTENVIGFIALSADPFTNAAGGDLSLNNTAGGGAALRALGFPSLYPAGLTANYVDVGASQHQDPASGGSGAPIGLGSPVIRAVA